jgi:hypothetical protein
LVWDNCIKVKIDFTVSLIIRYKTAMIPLLNKIYQAPFVRKAIEDKADLSAFREKPPLAFWPVCLPLPSVMF